MHLDGKVKMREKKRWFAARKIEYRLLICIAVCLSGFLYAACSTAKVVVNVNNIVKQAQASTDNWSAYMQNNGRSNYDSFKSLTTATASKLKVHWHSSAGGSISAQPLVVNGLVYWGSWDGYEHANTISGKPVWQAYLGKTTDSSCMPSTVGVASTPDIVSITFRGKSTPALIVGGGDDHLYALSPSTGKIIWKTAMGTSSSQFLWNSPAVYNGSVYIGQASFGDCPLVQGRFFQLDANTGVIQHTFDVVPKGCLGGTVWGSPAIDEAKGTVYFGTAEADACKQTETNASAIVEMRASDLHFLDSWQLPKPLQTSNGDFGSTPTLFQATVGGVKENMVGILNKNGTYYAFQRDALSKGPVWSATVAAPAVCPQCGDGNVAPAAWDGSKLYIAAGIIPVNDQKCQASLRAVDPATGVTTWVDCLQHGPVLGAVTAIPGMVIIGEGARFLIFASDTGHQLFSYVDTNATPTFYASASISAGVIYTGDSDGMLFAFGT